MAEITAALVKDLREKSGAGMMDCKKALTECDGDLEAAIDWLRTKGLAAAAKKSSRVAAEGLVGMAVSGNKGAIVEINAETDFVARNETFQGFVSDVAGLALAGNDDVEKLQNTAYPNGDGTVADQLTHLISTIGENMNLRRVEALSVDKGVIAAYMHNATVPGLGRIGVIIALESDGDAGKLDEFAMHIASTNPQSVSKDDLDPDAIERERKVLSQQAKDSGKSEEIIAKMVEGRLRKFYEEVCLLDQTFVIDGESKIAKAVEAVSKDAGASITVKGFVRFALGEGIEKQEEDFAAEVAAVAGV
jgi:elongation factor Ts